MIWFRCFIWERFNQMSWDKRTKSIISWKNHFSPFSFILIPKIQLISFQSMAHINTHIDWFQWQNAFYFHKWKESILPSIFRCILFTSRQDFTSWNFPSFKQQSFRIEKLFFIFEMRIGSFGICLIRHSAFFWFFWVDILSREDFIFL